MKRVGYLIDKIADLDNLYLAYLKARRGKRDKGEVQLYEANLHDYIAQLRNVLLSEQVILGNYTYFKIYDPKERMICAAPFKERVMHHAIMNVLHPYFDRHLISSSYATRLGKGVYAAIDRAMYGMKTYRYVVKLDVRKYFDSIDHPVLKAKIYRMFKDPVLLRLIDQLIDSYEVEPGKGLPIGNLTSQYFANHYLSRADHWAVDIEKIPLYIRYMDDILMFANSRHVLMDVVKRFEQQLRQEEKLTLKPIVCHPVHLGISFLGYRLCPYQIVLNGRSKRRFVQKMRHYATLFSDGIWTEKTYYEHITPLLAFVQHADSFRFREQTLMTVGYALEPRSPGW